MAMVEVGGQEYSIERKLKGRWDKLKDGRLSTIDEDRFYIVDGHEGAGKSLFTLQQAAYIDPTIIEDDGDKVLPRICFSVEEFLDAIRNTRSTKTHTKAVVFDEAFRGMSSKSALSKVNKKLVEALMEARQNNLVVFLVSPSFYMLEFYQAVLRSKALFHVVKEKNSRLRYVRIFNYKKKATLYQIGVRKGWGYPVKTKVRVRFFEKYPGGDKFEDKYRKKKRYSFKGGDEEESNTHRWKKQRNALLNILHNGGMTYKEMIKEMDKYDSSISLGILSKVCSDSYEGERKKRRREKRLSKLELKNSENIPKDSEDEDFDDENNENE